VLAQYADDTSLTLLGEERPTRAAVRTLEAFCLGSGLILNWNKSGGYWKDRGGIPRPPWTEFVGVTWIDDGADISKLLGTPFGLSLSTQNVDDFLKERVTKSLCYWCTTKVNSIGRSVVVNKILVSSVLFFVAIWGGSKKGVTKIRSMIESYMWSGSKNRTRTKVAWVQCCQPKDKGGLDLINPNDALIALMTKWVLKACEPGSSNLHVFLRHRLSSFQPYSGGRWSPSLDFFTQPRFQAKKGSTAWNRVGTSWRSLVRELIPVQAKLPEEVSTESLWWSFFTPQIGAGFPKNRAARLHKVGLRHIRDTRIDNRFLTNDEAQVKFGILPAETGAWNAMTQNLSTFWENLLTLRLTAVEDKEWIGCFDTDQGNHPKLVFQAYPGLVIEVGGWPQDWLLSTNLQLYTMLPRSNCLAAHEQPWHLQEGAGYYHKMHGTIRRVRVMSITRGPQKKQILLCYGQVDTLQWDPARIQWPCGDSTTPFMSYSASLGRKLLQKKHVIPDLVERKWQGILPLNFRLRWKSVWAKKRTPKEAGLLWLIWHRSVAINVWRARINRNLDRSCPVCPKRSEESVLHRFWECHLAQRAWRGVSTS
jgi:hypothetical protein